MPDTAELEVFESAVGEFISEAVNEQWQLVDCP
jgi:hypothetical protein